MNKNSPKIAVIFPSRGLAFSQTCEELLENLEGFDYEIFFAHGLPIPECFNKPLKRALRGAYTHFWFVEDDMILPKNTLKILLKAKVPAITCDYPVSREGRASVYRDPAGNAIYGGTGCLLVTREFIEGQSFRTDIAWDIRVAEKLEATPRKISGDVYGLHDVTFGLLNYAKGKTVRVSEIQCGQRKLLVLGQPGTNQGQHLTSSWTELTPQILEVPKMTNRNVVLGDGTVAFMDIKRARKLEKEDKLTIPTESYVELTAMP